MNKKRAMATTSEQRRTMRGHAYARGNFFECMRKSVMLFREWAHSYAHLTDDEGVPGKEIHSFSMHVSVSWCTLRRVPGEGFCVWSHAYIHLYICTHYARGVQGLGFSLFSVTLTHTRSLNVVCLLVTLREVPGEGSSVLV